MTSETWEPLEAKYKPLIIGLANEVRDYLIKDGYKCGEIDDLTDEDLMVNFLVHAKKTTVGVEFYLMDAATWDGEENGTSFRMDVSTNDGRNIGGLQPFNYTDQCWVDPRNEAAVAERWRIFSQNISPQAISEVIQTEA